MVLVLQKTEALLISCTPPKSYVHPWSTRGPAMLGSTEEYFVYQICSLAGAIVAKIDRVAAPLTQIWKGSYTVRNSSPQSPYAAFDTGTLCSVPHGIGQVFSGDVREDQCEKEDYPQVTAQKRVKRQMYPMHIAFGHDL